MFRHLLLGAALVLTLALGFWLAAALLFFFLGLFRRN